MRTCTPARARCQIWPCAVFAGVDGDGAVCHMFEKYQHLSLCSQRFRSLQEALERSLVWSWAEERSSAAAPVPGRDTAALPFPRTPGLFVNSKYMIVLKFWIWFCLVNISKTLIVKCCWITSYFIESFPTLIYWNMSANLKYTFSGTWK